MDTLTVLDMLIWIADHEGQESDADAGREARTAISTLIEADNAFDIAFHAWMHDRSNASALDSLCAAADVRAAALANVK